MKHNQEKNHPIEITKKDKIVGVRNKDFVTVVCNMEGQMNGLNWKQQCKIQNKVFTR